MSSHSPDVSRTPPRDASRPVPGRSQITIRVRYSECDPMGVAHHASYLPWMELGRTDLLRRAGKTYKSLEKSGVFFVITKVEVRYRRPIRYDDVVEIRTRIVGGSRVKLRHEYELVLIERDGHPPNHDTDPSVPKDGVLAFASTELACVGRDGKIQPLPEWLAQGE